jgi:hypothetical protein
VFWTKKKEVAEILKSASSCSTGIMVHLGTFLFTAFDGSSKVFTKCTSLDGNKGEKSLYETLKKNSEM